MDESVRDELKSRAAAEGASLNSYLRRLLTEAAAQPTRAAVLERVRRRSDRSEVSSASIVREGRDARAGWMP